MAAGGAGITISENSGTWSSQETSSVSAGAIGSAERHTGNGKMNLTRIRSVCARLIGMKYREMPGMGGHARAAVRDMLAELGAEFRGESGSPCCEVNNEYFRVGGRKLRVCTEDELFVSLWGSKAIVETVYWGAVEKMRARGCAGV